MDNYDSKTKLYRIVYILQSLGVDLGYEFTWYIYGPVSIRIMDHGWEFTNKPHVAEPYNLTAKERHAVEKIKKAGDLITDSENSEILASYLYLKDGKHGYGDKTIEELMIRKPRFKQTHIEKVVKQWLSTD